MDDPGDIWIRADSPIQDFAALLTAARAAPETIGYGTMGVGSDDHLAMLALERKSGARFLHAPFGGSAQVKQNLMSRSIPVAVMNVAEGIAEMRQGVLRPLAQMGSTRWGPLAEVPTLREFGFDVVGGSMRGMAAPAGLSPEVLARLALSVRRTVDDGDFQASAAQQNLPLRFLVPGGRGPHRKFHHRCRNSLESRLSSAIQPQAIHTCIISKQPLEHFPFGRAHGKSSKSLNYEHLYPIKRFRLIG